jgi:hypothetical protein
LLLQERAVLPSGQSHIVVRAIDAASLEPLAALLQQIGAQAGRRLSIVHGQAASIPDIALSTLASSPLVDRVSLDRLVVGALERTGATIASLGRLNPT